MLTNRQEAFVHEYLVDMNATKAALRAGYSPATVGEQGSRLLTQPEVSAAIAQAIAQRATRVGMQADAVLLEMSLLSLSRIDHYSIDDDGRVVLTDCAPQGALAAVRSVKRRKTTCIDTEGNTFTTVAVEIRLWDKTTPLRLLGRHVGLFADRIEHSGPGGGPITRIERVITNCADALPAPEDTKPER